MRVARFFLQGDKMKELGLPVPALNDREKTLRATSQIGFIEFIVSPLVFTMAPGLSSPLF